MRRAKWLLPVTVVVLVIAGWRLYREYFVFQGEEERVVLRELSEKASVIQASAKKLEIDPRLLASVIYAERRLNVTLVDSFEHLYAWLGHNSFIGLAQIRVNTAKWIMKAAQDSTSDYFVGSQYCLWLPSYETDEDVVGLLRDDSTYWRPFT